MTVMRLRRYHAFVLVAAAHLVTVALAFTSKDYASALENSLLFYDVQRSGKLPSWQRIKWRGDSGLKDGEANNVNLSGGFYDAGDNVKFGFPLAFTITLLAWDVVEFGTDLRAAGQLQNTLNNIKWGTDYLLNAYTGANELWVQIGDPNNDHQCWERPEEMDTSRAAYKVDSSHPGSDVAAETAAAFASASVAFRGSDKNYSAKLLSAAKKIFSFADKYRGKYSDSLSAVVCPFYCSYSGFQDELVWGATWLYKATSDNTYLQYLITNANTLGGATTTVNAFDWDNKYAGAQILIAQLVLSGTQGVQGYKDRADGYICAVLPSSISGSSQTSYTPGGLLFHSGQSNMQYVTTAAFLLTAYAKHLTAAKATLSCGGRRVTPAQLSTTSKKQVDYILGSNPRSQSYMVGFGTKFPSQAHHRAASMPSLSTHPQKIQCQQGWEYYNSQKANLNVATGAILGGPDQSDNLIDVRSNYAQMEPTLYINAPMVGVLASLASGSKSECKYEAITSFGIDVSYASI